MKREEKKRRDENGEDTSYSKQKGGWKQNHVVITYHKKGDKFGREKGTAYL